MVTYHLSNPFNAYLGMIVGQTQYYLFAHRLCTSRHYNTCNNDDDISDMYLCKYGHTFRNEHPRSRNSHYHKLLVQGVAEGIGGSLSQELHDEQTTSVQKKDHCHGL